MRQSIVLHARVREQAIWPAPDARHRIGMLAAARRSLQPVLEFGSDLARVTTTPMGSLALAVLLWSAPAVLLTQYDLGWLINALAKGVLHHRPVVLVALPIAIAYLTVSAECLIWASWRGIAVVGFAGFKVGLGAIACLAVALSLMAATLLTTAFFFDLVLWRFPTLI